jgi:hypothetical protein
LLQLRPRPFLTKKTVALTLSLVLFISALGPLPVLAVGGEAPEAEGPAIDKVIATFGWPRDKKTNDGQLDTLYLPTQTEDTIIIFGSGFDDETEVSIRPSLGKPWQKLEQMEITGSDQITAVIPPFRSVDKPELIVASGDNEAKYSEIKLVEGPRLIGVLPTFGGEDSEVIIKGDNFNLLKVGDEKNFGLYTTNPDLELKGVYTKTDQNGEIVLFGTMPDGDAGQNADLNLEFIFNGDGASIISRLEKVFYYRSGRDAKPEIIGIRPRTIPFKDEWIPISIIGREFDDANIKIIIRDQEGNEETIEDYELDTYEEMQQIAFSFQPVKEGWHSVKVAKEVGDGRQLSDSWSLGFYCQPEGKELVIDGFSQSEIPEGRLVPLTITLRAGSHGFQKEIEGKDGMSYRSNVKIAEKEAAVKSVTQDGNKITVVVETPRIVFEDIAASSESGEDGMREVPVLVTLYREIGEEEASHQAGSDVQGEQNGAGGQGVPLSAEAASGTSEDNRLYVYRPVDAPVFLRPSDMDDFNCYEGIEEKLKTSTIPIFNRDTLTAEGQAEGGSRAVILATGVPSTDRLAVYFGPQKAEVIKDDNIPSVAGYLGVGGESIPVHWIEVLTPPVPGNTEGVDVTLVNYIGDEPKAFPSFGRRFGITTKYGGYYYRQNKMQLGGFVPDQGPTTGGILMEIDGSNFGWSKDTTLLHEKTRIFFGGAEVPIGKKRIILGSGNDPDLIQVELPASNAGRVQVKVVTPFGEKIAPGTFTYYPPDQELVIEEVSPLVGTAHGGTELIIKGTGLQSSDTVWVGDRKATDVSVILAEREAGNGEVNDDDNNGTDNGDDNSADNNGEDEDKKDSLAGPSLRILTCKTPPGEPGPATIKIEKQGGRYSKETEEKFIYLSTPEITSVTPASGTVYGGTWLLLKGKGFLDKDTVTEYVPEENKEAVEDLQIKFAGKDADELVYLSPTEVAVKTPPGENPGPVDVELINPDAGLVDDDDESTGRAFKANGYEYRVPDTSPEIESLDPELGPVSGGTKVIISGTDFREDARVYFNWLEAPQVTRIDHSTLEVITPKAPREWVDEEDGVDVVVINTEGGGQSPPAKYYYVHPTTRPEIHSIMPDQGDVDGGTLVTIRGYDFGNVKQIKMEEPVPEINWPTVYFGSEKADIDELSDKRTILRVRTPAHEPGTVDVRIVNPDSAEVTIKNAFTYRYTTTDPKITGIDPKQGRSSGGTPVVISGSGFDTRGKVFFNNQPAQVDAAKSSETRLFVYSPAGKQEQEADVTVLNPDGASYTLTDAFKYIRDPRLQPRISQIVPNKGPITGGTVVDIWGSNLKDTADENIIVLVGGRPVKAERGTPDPDKDKADAGYVEYVQVEMPAAEKTGPVDVSVINADGGVFTIPGGFTYMELTESIELNNIVPARGPYLETIPAQINGGGLLAGAEVFLGGQKIEKADVIGDGTAIIFTIPAAPKHEEDLSLDVVVVNPNGATARLENGFTYVAEPGSEPEIDELIPGSGRATGGTPVEILGTGFEGEETDAGLDPGPVVFFGNQLAGWTALVSEEQISALTPPGPAGPTTVTVINPDGAMAKLIAGFIYVDKPGPHINSVDPNSGPSSGGTKITISGSQFDEGVKVLIGGSLVDSLERTNDSELRAITPEGDLGPANVTVTNPDGSSYTLPDAFTYIGPPKPPAGLEARAVSANTIELSWQETMGAVNYEIYGGESSRDQMFLVSTTGDSGTTGEEEADRPRVLYHYVRNLEPSTRYYFSLRAVNMDGISAQTLTASARTLRPSHSEPEFVPRATEFTVSGAGTGNAVITIPTSVLRDSRIRLRPYETGV